MALYHTFLWQSSNFAICMETQKMLNSQGNLEKEKLSQRFRIGTITIMTFRLFIQINILISSVFAGIVTIFVDIYTHLEAF